MMIILFLRRIVIAKSAALAEKFLLSQQLQEMLNDPKSQCIEIFQN